MSDTKRIKRLRAQLTEFPTQLTMTVRKDDMDALLTLAEQVDTYVGALRRYRLADWNIASAATEELNREERKLVRLSDNL